MKRTAAFLLILLFIVLANTACAETVITQKEQLNQRGKRVGVSTGSASSMIAEREFSNAEIVYFEDNATAYEAVAQGKVDAYIFDRAQMQMAINSGRKGVHLLDEDMEETVKVAVGISPRSAIPGFQDKLRRFLTEMKENGTLDDMYHRWVIIGDATIPDIQLPDAPEYHLTVGTAGTVPPFSYYVGSELNGYDIEFARRFAAWLHADLTFKVYDFGAIVPAAVSGDVDCIMSNLNITAERAEAIPFSDVTYENAIGIMVRGEAPTDQSRSAASAASVDMLNGKVIGVPTGATFDNIVKRRLPDVTFSYFNTFSDMVAALRSGKIAAFACDEPVLRTIIAENSQVTMLPECLETFEFGFIFGKDERGAVLCGQMSEFIRNMRESGDLAVLDEKWLSGRPDSADMPDIKALSGENGTLTLAIDALNPPFDFVQDNRYAGFEVELALRFCERYGYGLNIKNMDFDAVLASVQMDKVDFGSATISITEERAQSVRFSEAHYSGGTVLAVWDNKAVPSQNVPADSYTKLDQLDGKRIGVQTGTTAEEIALNRLPNIEIKCFSTFPDMAVALETNKIDGFLGDGLVLIQMAQENPGLKILDEKLNTYECGFVLAKNEKGRALCEEINAWIREMRESGELERILKKWTESPESERTVPDYRSLPAPKGVLTMATEGTFPPMNYYRGEECVGMEIELCARFCEACGYGLNVTTMDFGSGMLAAVQSGKVDFAISGIAITDERKQSVLFSDPYYTGGMKMAVLKAAAIDTARGYASLSDLEDKRIGVTTGSVQALLAEERFPNAQFFYFSNNVDMLNALRARKIDAYADAEALIKYMMGANADLTYLNERLGETMQVGAVFPKTDRGQALCDEFSDFIREIRQNGVYDEIQDIWFGGDEARRVVPDLDNLSATNGSLRVAVDTAHIPFAFIKDGKPVGVDIDIAVRFCKEKGYGLEIVQTDFAAIVPSVVAGKVDFACGGIAYTAERAESVLYSEPTYEGGSVMAILKEEETAPAVESEVSFWDEIVSSFTKTFIRENRWQLFVKGVITTLVITISSILTGTALGFLVFMLCRNGNPVANLITRFSLWLVQGMPMVVLLMILYYVIFASSTINGIAVAVIGFTLTFGSSVFGLLKMGVGAVEVGQYEAAYALGYSNWRTFFRIILPQALPHVVPAYKGEIVGLIKATAVVGYIAVQDLTKMGDIVRSRTYEAFFPLIAVTVIYFMLEGIIRRVVSRITIQFNPRHRRPEDILKGVKTNDQD